MITFLKIFLSCCSFLPLSVGSLTDARPPIGQMSRLDFPFYPVTSSTRVQPEMSVSIFLL
jgi:hypothetical protein